MSLNFPDGGQSTCAPAITNAQLTVTLASTNTFGTACPYYARIDDTQGTGANVTGIYEYVLVTANNTGTATLTITRGQGSTSAQAFSAGATVTAILLGEALTAAFARIDKANNAQYANFAIWGGIGPLVGGTVPNTATTQFFIQAGTNVGTTDANGRLTINFANAFPNGLLTVLASPGDTSSSLTSVIVAHSAAPETTSHFSATCKSGTGAFLISSLVRVNWIAIGW